ncbi:MAG: hypothetical protein R2865_16575 [Deinococcales bacterium]
MTTDSHLFKTAPAPSRLPLFEGKMIHQFTHQFSEPRYWIDEQEGRKELIGKKTVDSKQLLDYQTFRIGFRDIARNTDERTLISSFIPRSVFCGNTLNLSKLIAPKDGLFAIALMNSFVADWLGYALLAHG